MLSITHLLMLLQSINGAARIFTVWHTSRSNRVLVYISIYYLFCSATVLTIEIDGEMRDLSDFERGQIVMSVKLACLHEHSHMRHIEDLMLFMCFIALILILLL